MHIMLKRTFIFLAMAIVAGALAWSDIFPIVTRPAQFFGAFSAVVMMFCAAGYSLRADDSAA